MNWVDAVWTASPYIFFSFVFLGVALALYLMFLKRDEGSSAGKH